MLNFHPADSLLYNKYALQVDSATAANTNFMTECQNFADTFGCVDIKTSAPCERYWVRKPAMCQVSFKVDAVKVVTVGENNMMNVDVGISNTVTLLEDDSKILLLFLSFLMKIKFCYHIFFWVLCVQWGVYIFALLKILSTLSVFKHKAEDFLKLYFEYKLTQSLFL